MSKGSVSFLPGSAGERTLLARLQAGEEAAFQDLHAMFAPRLYRVLLHAMGSQAEAEDALQETFLSAYRSLPTAGPISNLLAWLTCIAVRRGLNARRAAARQRANVPEPPPPQAPLSSLEQGELARKVLLVMGGLTPEKRLALALVAEGFTAAEIAAITAEPRGTVLARVARARVELGERCAEAGLDLEWFDRQREGR